MLWKCCTQYAGKFGKQQRPQGWKSSVFTPIPKKGNAKECSNYYTIALISHARKILQARLQWYVNQEVEVGFRKGRGTRYQISDIHWIIEKAREFQKNFYFCFIDYTKAFVCITTNYGKFFKRWEYQTTLPASWETCMQVKKQQSEPDMEQWTGSKLGKEYIKAVYCHPTYLTSMQTTSCETLGWMKLKMKSRLQGEIPITSDMQITLP